MPRLPSPLDAAHVQVQTRLRSQVGQGVAGVLDSVALDRSALVEDEYVGAVTRLIAGGQQQAATFATSYVGQFAPPRAPLDLPRALGEDLMTYDSPEAASGLRRLWSLLDDGVEESEARAQAGAFASELAELDLTAAMRDGLDEGARVSGREPRWRLEPAPGACEWCQFIADTGARYFSADTVPVPHAPAGSGHPSAPPRGGGVCNCSPAPDFDWAEPEPTAPEAPAELVELDELQIAERDRAIEGIPLEFASGEKTRGPITRAGLDRSFENIRPEVIRNLGLVRSNGQDFSGRGAMGYYFDKVEGLRPPWIAVRPGQYAPKAWAEMQPWLGDARRQAGAPAPASWFTPDSLVKTAAERTITHEVGHFLDYQLTQPQRAELFAKLQPLGIKDWHYGQLTSSTQNTIGQLVSNYPVDKRVVARGHTQTEIVAELWAEYKTSPTPRAPARTLGTYIEDKLGWRPTPG